LDAFCRHATLPLLFRGFQAITGRDKPGCTGEFQHSWQTWSALELLSIMLLMQRTFTAFVRPDRADARPDFLTVLVFARVPAVVEDIRWCVWHRNVS
jgi:hypothetical protein